MATIFVSLISYRDSEAQWTIEDLFSQARFPERIFIGYCGQYDLVHDAHCFVKPCSRPAQVRSMMLDYRQARGPCFARALAQALWEDEDYFLQIDSHMRFVKDWDEKLIAMLAQCNSEKPVLTMYPPEYKLGSPVPKNSMPNLLCAKQFDKDGMLRIRGRRLKVRPKTPIPSLFWAAGFMFASSQFLQEVPYDVHMKNIFFGEEISMLVRLWTKGWDCFCPSENVLFHLWERDYRPSFREVLTRDVDRKLQETSRDKVLQLLSVDSGNVRSLQAFEEFCGVDFKAKSISPRGLVGGLAESSFAADASAVPQALLVLLKQQMIQGLDVSNLQQALDVGGEDEQKLDIQNTPPPAPQASRSCLLPPVTHSSRGCNCLWHGPQISHWNYPI